MQVSVFAAAIEPSATLAAGAKAKELKAAGINVFDFALGEPDFNTPAHICAAAEKAARDGQTRYTPANGTPALRKAVAEYHQKVHGLNYKPAEVCISSGCKHAIYTALAAVLNPGDEVVIPAPYWVSYSDMVKMTGAVPVVLQTSAKSGFKLAPEQLREACGPKTRLLMINSPSNPTGSTYSKSELAALGKVAVEKDLIVLSDEIYDRLIYVDEPFQAFAAIDPEFAKRTITLNGVSKTYAMTGWRIGWAMGPANIIEAMTSIQSQQTGNPCSVSQAAAVAALTGDQGCVGVMKAEFVKRRNYVADRIPKIAGLKMGPPDGAFYAFFDVSAHFGKKFNGVAVKDSTSFCLAALQQAHVNIVQGSAFGSEGFARLSFATSMDQLSQGLDALEAWLKTGV